MVRLRPLLPHQPSQLLDALELAGGDALRGEVGALWSISRWRAVAVLGQEAPRIAAHRAGARA